MIFIETPLFTRQIEELVDDDHYRQLQLRLVIERKLFDELTRSTKQADAIARGERAPSRSHKFTPSRIQAVREQARREPTGAAKALLRIVEKEPMVALRALRIDAT